MTKRLLSLSVLRPAWRGSGASRGMPSPTEPEDRERAPYPCCFEPRLHSWGRGPASAPAPSFLPPPHIPHLHQGDFFFTVAPPRTPSGTPFLEITIIHCNNFINHHTSNFCRPRHPIILDAAFNFFSSPFYPENPVIPICLYLMTSENRPQYTIKNIII